jgi:hypothetical protein
MALNLRKDHFHVCGYEKNGVKYLENETTSF